MKLEINEEEHELGSNLRDVKMCIREVEVLGGVDLDNIKDYKDRVDALMKELNDYLLPQIQEGLELENNNI